MPALPLWVRRFVRANAPALRRLGADLSRTYGCGANGCAFPTRGGRWTVKVTADPSEVGIVRAIERLRSNGASLGGVVRVKKVGTGRNPMGGPSVWVIVREAFRPIKRPCPAALRHDVAVLEAAAAIARSRNEEAHAGRPTSVVERAFLEELARVRGPGREVASTMRSLARRGTFLEDVRLDNLGLVRRGSRTALAVTDPGGNLEYPSFSAVPRLNPQRRGWLAAEARMRAAGLCPSRGCPGGAACPHSRGR